MPFPSQPSTANRSVRLQRSHDPTDHATSATPESKPSPTPESRAAPCRTETNPQTRYQGTGPDDDPPETQTYCPVSPDDRPAPQHPTTHDRPAPHPTPTHYRSS